MATIEEVLLDFMQQHAGLGAAATGAAGAIVIAAWRTIEKLAKRLVPGRAFDLGTSLAVLAMLAISAWTGWNWAMLAGFLALAGAIARWRRQWLSQAGAVFPKLADWGSIGRWRFRTIALFPVGAIFVIAIGVQIAVTKYNRNRQIEQMAALSVTLILPANEQLVSAVRDGAQNHAERLFDILRRNLVEVFHPAAKKVEILPRLEVTYQLHSNLYPARGGLWELRSKIKEQLSRDGVPVKYTLRWAMTYHSASTAAGNVSALEVDTEVWSYDWKIEKEVLFGRTKNRVDDKHQGMIVLLMAYDFFDLLTRPTIGPLTGGEASEIATILCERLVGSMDPSLRRKTEEHQQVIIAARKQGYCAAPAAREHLVELAAALKSVDEPNEQIVASDEKQAKAAFSIRKQ